MIKTKYRKNSKWSSITFIYNVKDDLDRMIIHKLEEKYKDEKSVKEIDIVDVNISNTKTPDYKYVIVLFAEVL